MQLYYQSVRNSQTDIPVLTCAAARMETGDYRIVIGARPLRAVRFELPAEPALAPEQLAAQFAENVKAQNRYRLQYARQRRIPQASGRRADKARGTGTGTA